MPTDRPGPLATYRIQLQPGFGFDDVAALAPYLAALGTSHLYASPYLQAAPGSMHGYDVADPSRVNSELGGAEAHRRMCAALGDAGLGQILDIVPNHMAVTPTNAWWWDVLENGAASPYASYFDVDWGPGDGRLHDTVLMPVLGDHYGRVLEAGEITLSRDGGGFVIRYYEHALPVAPRSLDELLAVAAEACGSDELESLATAFGRLPPSTATDRESVRERHRDKEVLRASLTRLLESDPEVAAAVDAEVARINGDVDVLDALLERQNFRLAFWRTAGSELDYRRFFDIHTLVALRTEDEAVFADTHALVSAWLGDGVIDGLRIDHPDGLRDPGGYLDRLRAEAGPSAWIVVEKITERGERLPREWPVAGTTGYDFANLATGLFVDPAGEEAFTAAYHAFTASTDPWDDVVTDKKHLVMRTVLSAEVSWLTRLAGAVCERHRRYRDYTRADLDEALREIIAGFPVYRTYVVPGQDPSTDDRRHVSRAVEAAKAHKPDLDPELCDFLAAVLLGTHAGGQPEDELLARFQQVTGPVMAKGVEDTAFYTYVRLACLNEVGGDPSHFGVSVDEFHQANAERATHWPAAMLASSTHDTKRSEDVRARSALLSEIPEAFAEAAAYWSAHNKKYRSEGLPDRNIEWLLYQTLVGAWPLPAERAVAYVEKAAKEAKEHTSWVDPNPAYDEALRSFVEAILADTDFVKALATFTEPLVEPGRVNSLAQTLLKLTAPGVPDVYQGCELWDLSLVDPDNRRPVDWGLRLGLLAECDGLSPAEAWARADEGLPKLMLTTRALHFRRRRAEVFTAGAYTPLSASGARAGHVVAFARADAAVTVVPRLVLGLGDDWGDTSVTLPGGDWRDVLDGERRFSGTARGADLFGPFPVALLEAT
ncbi:MAG: malto-oligosyltrehalose synthase [Acidimicrobiia bacterium]